MPEDIKKTSVAQAIDNSHKEPSEVKPVMVKGAPVLSDEVIKIAENSGAELVINRIKSEDKEANILNSVAISFIQHLGKNPTYEQFMAFRASTREGIEKRLKEGLVYRIQKSRQLRMLKLIS